MPKLKFESQSETLVGELALPTEPDSKYRGRVLVFIHGLYQHKNIAFLKSFGNRIPEELGIATFRFDCRGLGESTGVTKYTPHFQNLQDLEAALDFLYREHQLQCHCLFGYSAGGNVAILHAAQNPGTIPYIVNCSGRFKMDGVADTMEPEESAALEKDGRYTYTFTKRGKKTSIEVTHEDLALFSSINNDTLCAQIPSRVHCLFVHGLADDRVPTADTALYANAVASSTNYLLPGGGHNYNEREGLNEELYDLWKAWFEGGAEARLAERRKMFGKL